jgi:hypothetical protein
MPLKKYVTKEEMVQLVVSRSAVAMNEIEAIYCYGMSLMTVVDEARESTKGYKRIQFVEYLEMIGRIADMKFKGSEMERLPLH